ncbi:MAG: hypothetical protein ACPL2N_03360 [Candidatus Cryosericum sp.]
MDTDMTDKLVSLHITIPELRGILPNTATVVSTAFWVPLADFVLRRAGVFEVVCQREDAMAIKLLMPLAETIERRREDGALMFWGTVTPGFCKAIANGHGSGHDALWWWQIALSREGEQVFALREYGAVMDLFALNESEVNVILELLPCAARTSLGSRAGSD